MECDSKEQALAVEKYIKRMKSKVYIQNLKKKFSEVRVKQLSPKFTEIVIGVRGEAYKII